MSDVRFWAAFFQGLALLVTVIAAIRASSAAKDAREHEQRALDAQSEANDLRKGMGSELSSMARIFREQMERSEKQSQRTEAIRLFALRSEVVRDTKKLFNEAVTHKRPPAEQALKGIWGTERFLFTPPARLAVDALWRLIRDWQEFRKSHRLALQDERTSEWIQVNDRWVEKFLGLAGETIEKMESDVKPFEAGG